jgi:hypothetical protein
MTTNKWKEKRQSVRSSFGWPVALINFQGATISGRVRDISSGGALIHINTKLEVNDQIQVAINIPDINDFMLAIGTIVKVFVLDEEASSPTYALGICFTKVTWRSSHKD